MQRTDPTLAEAQRVAGLSQTDRLDGKHGEEAREAILRLLEATGLDYADALKLMSAVEWGKWNEGWRSGYDGALNRTHKTKTTEV